MLYIAFKYIMYIAGVVVNPGKNTVYHMCKTWLKEVHSGWEMGGGGECK